LLSGLVVTTFALFLFLFPGATKLVLVLMFIVSVVTAIIRSFFTPAITAAIPDIASEEQLTASNSIIQSTSQVSVLIGQGLGGMLFRILGAPLLFLIDGISYLLSFTATLFIHIPQNVPERSKDWRTRLNIFKKDTADGLAYIWRNPGIRIVFLSAACLNFFIAPIFVVLPFYVEDYLKLRTDWYGYLIVIFSVGMIAGYGLAGIFKVTGRVRSTLVSVSFVLFSLMIGLMGIVHTLPAAITVIIGCGIFMGYVNINIMTILQTTTDAAIRGRVFGNLTTLTAAIMPVGFGLSGVVIDLLGKRVEVLLIICGGILVLVSMLVVTNRNFFNFFAFDANEKTFVMQQIK
jgi:MFS transporter, DHA3 family, macrolide efflux protein